MDTTPPERTEPTQPSPANDSPKPRTKPASADDDPIESCVDFQVGWLTPHPSPSTTTPTTSQLTELTNSQASTVSSQPSANSQESNDGDGPESKPNGTLPPKKRKSDALIAEDPLVALLTAVEPPLTSQSPSPAEPPATVVDAAAQLFGPPGPSTGGALNVEHLFGTFGANAPFAPTSAADAPATGAAATGAAIAAPTGGADSEDAHVGLSHVGKCHNCMQDGHWASDCKFILSKMLASRETKCALCPFVIKTHQDTIAKLGCGPFTYQWVHRPCAMQHLVTLGVL